MKKSLPMIKLGDKMVTRLIAGGNPLGGGAHSTRKTSEQMYYYFNTGDRLVNFLLHCEEEGINTVQSSYSTRIRDALRKARERGSNLQWFMLGYWDEKSEKWTYKDALELKPIAIVHHGEVTDSLFRAGQQAKIRDTLKLYHDMGVLAGISSHSPQNLLRCEDAGYENDFYMGAFYNIRRDPDELKRAFGGAPLDELYFKSDPLHMTAQLRQFNKTCLGFKILGAGRVCTGKQAVGRRFAFALSNLKPVDGVIVGMYPVFHDEVAEDAEYVRQSGAAKQEGQP
jgi:hypothetical protein